MNDQSIVRLCDELLTDAVNGRICSMVVLTIDDEGLPHTMCVLEDTVYLTMLGLLSMTSIDIERRMPGKEVKELEE